MRGNIVWCAVLIALVAVPASAQTWNIQVVDDAGLTGYQSRLAVTSDGTPYILYLASGYWAWMARWVPSGDGGGWDKWPLEFSVPYYKRMGFVAGPGDSLHIALSRSSPDRIQYNIYHHPTQTWALAWETAADYIGDVSLALIDSAGVVIPTIVYAQYLSPWAIRFARRDPGGGTWTDQTIFDDARAERPWIAIDSQFHAHVCFYETYGDNLMYATNAGGTWVYEYVDLAGNVGQYSAIAIDTGDVPYIVYYDATNQDLKYARLVGP